MESGEWVYLDLCQHSHGAVTAVWFGVCAHAGVLVLQVILCQCSCYVAEDQQYQWLEKVSASVRSSRLKHGRLFHQLAPSPRCPQLGREQARARGRGLHLAHPHGRLGIHKVDRHLRLLSVSRRLDRKAEAGLESGRVLRSQVMASLPGCGTCP